MSYGIVPYGKQAYGGIVADLSLVRAKPASTNVLRVTLTKEPQRQGAQYVGDVLNPRTWQITRDDTGVGFTVLSVSLFDDPLVWDIRILEAFASANIQHTVSAPSLLDNEGSPIDAPRSATFNGITASAKSSDNRQAASRRYAIRDFNNPQPATSIGSEGGVYVIANGDYQLHEGTDFVRKQIFRRLMTSKGGFTFLPNFGVGLRVKEPVPAGDLITLQKEITDQVKLEPEVEAVRVVVTQAKNQLTVQVLARLKSTGQQISVPVEVPFSVNF